MRKIFNIIVYIFAIIGFILLLGYVAIRMGWTKTSGTVDNQRNYFKDQLLDRSESGAHPLWSQSEEWAVLKQAILKDGGIIKEVATKTDISPRTIVAVLMVEQLRLFHSNREIFKSIFEPLKIMGTQSQFSWGVMGIKQDTAKIIESNLKNPTSVFYPGKKYEHLFDYNSSEQDIDAERFARLTNEHDRTFSYLYGSMMLKEIEAQWEKSGFLITDKPQILATLFNIGFSNSHPNSDPKVGGAQIDIGTTTYNFGGLAGSFYYSDEMLSEFPR